MLALRATANRSGGCGEYQRKFPSGGDAYGMPLKLKRLFDLEHYPRLFQCRWIQLSSNEQNSRGY